jgi:cystathionine beta-lyase/cystathionine gamma-synthase
LHEPLASTRPHAPPIYLSSVYECEDPQQADDLLSGRVAGYVYARDAHPNADMLAERCRELHGAERATVTSSGMGALALALVTQLHSGEHLVASNQLYGRSRSLLVEEAGRLGIASSVVDTCDLAAVRFACTAATRLIVVESISNPLLRVCDIAALAALASECGARLLVDNTFAGPLLCRPLDLGADLVLESLTKTMNGHSDVVLGLLCGRESAWQRVPAAQSTWGLASSPLDCWLALRGLGTLELRIERACASALAVAEFLRGKPPVERVVYPGLAEHPDHALATRQFAGRYGTIVAVTLHGGAGAATRFIAASGIPFCPSLGEIDTTLSHPESTSHRALSPAERAALGISGGTLRLSIGIEPTEAIVAKIDRGLAAASE